MKSNENKDLKSKKKVSNDLLVKVIQNIIDIDLNSINKSRKRSFSHLNFFLEKRNSKNIKLFKKSIYEEENEDKFINNDSSIKQINFFDKNANLGDDNNSLDLKKHRNSLRINDYVSQPRIRKNFILKSELYDLNKKDEEQKESNIIINDNKNNNISNKIQEEKKIKNIDINQESSYKSNDNLISNYFETDLSKDYSKNDNNNIINQNEINNNNNNNEKDKYINSINNNNNINYNINNYYYTFPYSPMIPYFNYNNFINIGNNQINKNDYIKLTKTQNGCQILINRIISEPNFANEILLPNIKNELKEICTDIFGSPMIKILLLNLNQQSIDLFLNSIKDYMIYIPYILMIFKYI
jgi:hypothetical protein